MLPTSGAWHVEDVVTERRAAELLAHVRELGERRPGAAVLRGQVRGPEAGRSGALCSLLPDVRGVKRTRTGEPAAGFGALR